MASGDHGQATGHCLHDRYWLTFHVSLFRRRVRMLDKDTGLVHLPGNFFMAEDSLELDPVLQTQRPGENETSFEQVASPALANHREGRIRNDLADLVEGEQGEMWALSFSESSNGKEPRRRGTMVGIWKQFKVDKRRKVDELFTRCAEFFQAVQHAFRDPDDIGGFSKQLWVLCSTFFQSLAVEDIVPVEINDQGNPQVLGDGQHLIAHGTELRKQQAYVLGLQITADAAFQKRILFQPQ